MAWLVADADLSSTIQVLKPVPSRCQPFTRSRLLASSDTSLPSDRGRSDPTGARPGPRIAYHVFIGARQCRPLSVRRRRQNKGKTVMDNIIKRFRGRKTGQGHELAVKNEQGVITIGFKHFGEYEEEYDPFIHVARIERTGDVYHVGWFHDDGEEPSTGSEYTREDDLFAALNEAIEQRSKEVGTSGG
jgi:hypothetical protein